MSHTQTHQDGTEGEGNCTTSGVSICGEEDTVTVVSSWNPERTQLSVIPTGLQPDLNYTLIIPQGAPLCFFFFLFFFYCPHWRGCLFLPLFACAIGNATSIRLAGVVVLSPAMARSFINVAGYFHP